MPERDVVDIFLDALRAFTDAVEHPAVAAHWNDPSAVDQYTVGGLVGHTARSLEAIDRYLAAPPPTQSPIPGGAYYARLLSVADDSVHAGIRERGVALGDHGQAAVVQLLRELPARVEPELRADPDRLVEVINGTIIRLSDYLETRILEVAIHHDDLVSSVEGVEPGVDDDALRVTAHHLLGVAMMRHSPLEVVRALARRERQTEPVFPVL